jgi:hypothetical protein
MLYLQWFKSYGAVRYLGQVASAILDLCKLDHFPTMQFAMSSHLPNLNVLAQTDQKLWPCPLLRSKASAILSLCKFMQIRPLSQNPFRYTSLHTKFERCISNGLKVMALSVIWVK